MYLRFVKKYNLLRYFVIKKRLKMKLKTISSQIFNIPISELKVSFKEKVKVVGGYNCCVSKIHVP